MDSDNPDIYDNDITDKKTKEDEEVDDKKEDKVYNTKDRESEEGSDKDSDDAETVPTFVCVVMVICL